ncbi:general substrate transporter [Dothidotthia symphoricarpi CBS 119687]|uniref:General substrate transporter n=1 Tax=Dothidotthia symphoricarpi CBS 119687 TaxID=1392245 RepID=A0A6A6A873_9PLEO|nr:general substrate transporter [Dothidotthia symphoricarpi CBS 119687]KAF2128162.1 general substrate transporter [Dothidotthia symphoricarpi CBS 119687]
MASLNVTSFHHDLTSEKVGALQTEEVVIQRLTDDDLFRMSRDAMPRFWTRTGWRLCLVMFVQGCNQAGYGVDWAVIGNINSYKSWHNYFGFETSGTTFAHITALMRIGTVCGAPFLALNDKIGRRGVMFLGNAMVIVAALMQGLAPNVSCFMAGRFFLGFGSALMSTPQYIAEVSPVHLRGRIVGLFGACFQIGSVVMNAGMIGTATMAETNNWSWRIPLLLQSFFPLVVCTLIYLCTPESPRYLIMKGKRDEAKEVIAKYMTNSESTSEPLVNVVIAQIEESLETTRTGFRQSWNFAVFVTKIVRYRLMVLILYSMFQSWNGGGIVSYYLTPALETVGVVATIPQLGISLGLTATYFIFTAIGGWFIDLFKRRTLIFAGLIGIICMQTAATITSWQYNLKPSTTTSALTIMWMFMFQIISALFIATMHNLYPVEILSLPLRAKGMGLYGVIQGAAGAIEAYGISIGISKIGYKIWVVYIVYNCLQLIAAYFVFPETSKLTLEEIDAVFETPGTRPVPMSLTIQKAKVEKMKLEREASHGDVLGRND